MLLRLLKMSYYAVAKGRTPGIFKSWSECEFQVKGFSGAVYKKFKSLNEAQAFVDGQPSSKRMKTDFVSSEIADGQALRELNKKRKITNFNARIDKFLIKKPSESSDDSSDSVEQDFLKIPEYEDKPATSKDVPVPKKNVQSSKRFVNSTEIKFETPDPTTVKHIGRLNFNVDSQDFVHVYTDGSCLNNGKFTAAAGFGVFFGDDHTLNTSQPVKGKPTNNSGEIQAAIYAIETAQLHNVKRLKIFTDSQFVMNSVCIWMTNWKKKNWKLASGKAVANMKDFKHLDELIEKGNMLIKWCYIPAHRGYHGNEQADKLAKEGAEEFKMNKIDD